MIARAKRETTAGFHKARRRVDDRIEVRSAVECMRWIEFGW